MYKKNICITCAAWTTSPYTTIFTRRTIPALYTYPYSHLYTSYPLTIIRKHLAETVRFYFCFHSSSNPTCECMRAQKYIKQREILYDL